MSGWAIVFGIIGGRVYHVVSDPELYFKHGEHPLNALKIWDGGLGIWGAVALGALGAWIGCHRKGIRLSVFADVVIPGVVAAQGLGRWGTGSTTSSTVDRPACPGACECTACTSSAATPTPNGTADGGQICHGSAVVAGLFQPTFLYESVWDISLALILIWISRRWRLGSGQLFAIYVMGYTAGRGWIEALRHDHANHILGLRLNDWTSILVFLFGVALFLRCRGDHHDQPYLSGQPEQMVSVHPG